MVSEYCNGCQTSGAPHRSAHTLEGEHYRPEQSYSTNPVILDPDTPNHFGDPMRRENTSQISQYRLGLTLARANNIIVGTVAVTVTVAVAGGDVVVVVGVVAALV